MGPIGDEGRGQLRKAAGIGRHELIRRYPNGATHPAEGRVSRAIGRRTGRTETSKYPQEKKTTCDSPSSGERKGTSPNHPGYGRGGVVGPP